MIYIKSKILKIIKSKIIKNKILKISMKIVVHYS